MVDRCRIGLYEEVPDLPTTLFIAEHGTQLLHKCYFDGVSFESVATFDNGLVSNLNPKVLYDGNEVHYMPRFAASSTIYRIDPDTMTALDTDGQSSPGPNFITSGLLDLKYVVFDSNGQIQGYDSNMDQINPWVDGFIFFSNYVGYAGGTRGGHDDAIKGNPAHWPTNTAIIRYQSYVDFEYYMAKVNVGSIIRDAENFRCLELNSVDSVNLAATYPTYHDPLQSVQMYSDPDRWIHYQANEAILSFHEFGNPNFRTSLDFGFGIIQPFGGHNAIAVTTNDTVLFLKGTPTVKLWMLPDSLTATVGDLVEITNTDAINLGSTTPAGIAIA